MFDIQHDGFVARLSVAGDLIRGEVLDLHEYLNPNGSSPGSAGEAAKV